MFSTPANVIGTPVNPQDELTALNFLHLVFMAGTSYVAYFTQTIFLLFQFLTSQHVRFSQYLLC